MVNIKHPTIMDTQLLVNLLVTNRTPLAEAAKILDVPYNSLRFQAKKRLSSKQWKTVVGARHRKTYTQEQKVFAINKAEQIAKKRIEESNSRSRHVKQAIYREVYEQIGTKYGIEVSLLKTWRQKYFQKKKKSKGVEDAKGQKPK